MVLLYPLQQALTTMMKVKLSRCAALLGLLLTVTTNAQFSCTFTASDENSCLGTTADDGDHCVWCSVSSYGFCVSEKQAESMEANIPGIECDRYSSNDDDSTPSDDDAAPTDDEAPTDDVTPNPTDDSLPDDYWTCLQKKDTKTCVAEGCTWCDTKGGFGLCMTGPSADMASNSDWFKCTKGNDKVLALAEDPYDTSCLMAYLQDPTEEGCKSAVDEDGAACEYCAFQGSVNLCLTEEQAEMGEQIGIECGPTSLDTLPRLRGFQDENSLKDPFDPSCALAFLQDQSEETCKSAVDSDGNACEYCTLQGALNLCLNKDQAEAGEQIGIVCDDSTRDDKVEFPNDFWDCLENYDADGCSENSCTWCNTETGVGFCFANAAADALHECNFFDCDYKLDPSPKVIADPFDPACLAAGMNSDDAESMCNSTKDSSGNSCTWCNAAGVFGLCLSSEQAAAAAGEYLTCDNTQGILAVA